ncbi:hypothetical protein DET1479 [Dehalococcoides mccartyi 195]|uniref:Uncharacterized protein n=1 Tax=Dehalococcoides mccartyi (strain ATCC BAA-2266 / KCTC 15142 / 195) TaxID=243164 RepID=Q3Z6H0_DEHM1|nr:hypothetical protein DET1479 [Dehalococcoides mccartyi 195]
MPFIKTAPVTVKSKGLFHVQKMVGGIGFEPMTPCV